jgi:hypothetical protein
LSCFPILYNPRENPTEMNVIAGPDGDDDDMRKTECLRKWLGDALPVTPLEGCVRACILR